MPKLKVIDGNAQIVPPQKNYSPDYNLDALHALVVAFGPREAARQANLPAGRVLRLAWKHHWQQSLANFPPNKPGRKPKPIAPTHSNPSTSVSIANQSPANALGNALTQLKHKSTMGLATYSAKAATALNKVRNPLDVTRKAVDISDVHKSIWPAEGSGANILQIGFLVQGK
jgi:hypothetical protein